jgi:hypothetical protein
MKLLARASSTGLGEGAGGVAAVMGLGEKRRF